MNNLDYAEKLKDPRWQRKRLEILARDEWECQACGNKNSTLHVHHLRYTKSDPWDEQSFNLTTLCDNCHAREHGLRESAEQFLIQSMRNLSYLQMDIVDAAIHLLTTFEPRIAARRLAKIEAAQQQWREAREHPEVIELSTQIVDLIEELRAPHSTEEQTEIQRKVIHITNQRNERIKQLGLSA